MDKKKHKLDDTELEKVSGGNKKASWECKHCGYTWEDDFRKTYIHCPSCKDSDIRSL